MGHKRKSWSATRCNTCQWHYGHIFHVCVDASDPSHKKVRAIQKNRWTGPRDAAYREKIAEAQTRRWAEVHERNRERDEKIVERYAVGDIGLKQLGREFNLNYRTVRDILARRGAAIRPQGLVLKYDTTNK